MRYRVTAIDKSKVHRIRSRSLGAAEQSFMEAQDIQI